MKHHTNYRDPKNPIKINSENSVQKPNKISRNSDIPKSSSRKIPSTSYKAEREITREKLQKEHEKLAEKLELLAE